MIDLSTSFWQYTPQTTVISQSLILRSIGFGWILIIIIEISLLPLPPPVAQAYPRDLTAFFRRPIPSSRTQKSGQFPAPATRIYLSYICMCNKKGENIAYWSLCKKVKGILNHNEYFQYKCGKKSYSDKKSDFLKTLKQ